MVIKVSGNQTNSKGRRSYEGYRLPTEAESEYLALAGESSRSFYSGSNIIDNVAWYEDNSENKTHEVGLKNSNQFGIYDMIGNIWEWCYDYYNKDYYKETKKINPVNTKTANLKVVRGGSWKTNSSSSYISNRYYSYPNCSFDYIGFRVVRTFQYDN